MKPISRQENLVVRDTNGETLIYDLKSNKAYLLNETSAFIWNQCDGKNDVKEIAEQLVNKIKSPVTEDLVWLALSQLKDSNLMENNLSLPSELKGLTRRQIIKRVGLSTMVAIPMVSSLIVPTAALAASNCAADGTTVSGNIATIRGRCCSGRYGYFIGGDAICCSAPFPAPPPATGTADCV